MGKYFGTDGFRGEANRTLTVDHAYQVGRYLGWYYGQEHRAKIVIGKDTRRSGYMFEYALVAGLTASGADAYLLHVTTTPSVSYVTRTENFDCGIMISASHNPYYDNGIKLINRRGEKMGEDVIALVERYLDGKGEQLPLATGNDIGGTVDYALGRNRYTGYVISLARHSYRGLHVGLDCANGSTWMLAKSIFDALGAKTTVIAAEPDGFNINNGCGSTHPEKLQALVKEQHLDIGFAFDGDADRCLAVDEQGNLLTGDHILTLCARYLKRRGELSGNAVAATVMSNLGLFRALEEEQIACIRTDVGDKYVYEAMVKHGLALGGEESGHIIFSKYATTGDGLITAIQIMEVMLESKVPLSRLTEGFTLYPQYVKSVRVADKEAVLGDPQVLAAKDAVQQRLGDRGRLLLRRSGTEPVVRVMAEAPDDITCRAAVDSVVQVILRQGYAVD